MSELDPQVAWLVPCCQACGWRGLPSRTPEHLEELPIDCPRCGRGLGGEVRKGSWRQFSLARLAALRGRS